MGKRFWTRSSVSMENYVMQPKNSSDCWQQIYWSPPERIWQKSFLQQSQALRTP